MLEIRKYRIFNIAIFDLVTSLVATILIFAVAKKKYFDDMNMIPFIIAGILVSIPLGIFVHVIFGINTQLNYSLQLSKKPE